MSRPRARTIRGRNSPGHASTLSANDRGAEVEELQKRLARFGYAAQLTRHYDDDTRMIVTAFQRHFRPARVDGLADVSTRETLARLLAKR